MLFHFLSLISPSFFLFFSYLFYRVLSSYGHLCVRLSSVSVGGYSVQYRRHSRVSYVPVGISRKIRKIFERVYKVGVILCSFIISRVLHYDILLVFLSHICPFCFPLRPMIVTFQVLRKCVNNNSS